MTESGDDKKCQEYEGVREGKNFVSGGGGEGCTEHRCRRGIQTGFCKPKSSDGVPEN